MSEDLSRLIAGLRVRGGDNVSVEVKSAAGGLPESLTKSLSALANLPGGGLIILGLDERSGFRPVALNDPTQLKQGLASKARHYVPPVQVTVEDGIVDGAPVIVARVRECDPSMKPCRAATDGMSYLRGFDGDFRLSDLEIQAFLASRKAPMFDRGPCEGAKISDLDAGLVGDFVNTARAQDPAGIGRFTDPTELLTRAGVLDPAGTPTVAGMLALGAHPQQWFPRFVIQASAEPNPGDPPTSRARNQITISGPIPQMLDAAMAWAQRTFDTSIITHADGTVHDRYTYPLVAFRELIANALIHRDLDQWSAGMAIEVRLRRDRLVISNPGGLYGITVDRLGADAVTSARNTRLAAICQHVRSPAGDGRVIEALASGMPIITQALTDAGLPSAHYIDAGIRFTAILRTPATDSPEKTMTASETRIYDMLANGPKTVAELAEALQLSHPGARKGLGHLRKLGLVTQHGGQGRKTTYYERTDTLDAAHMAL